MSLVFGAFYWLLDSIIDSIFFHSDRGFFSIFFIDEPRHLWMRIFTVVVLLVFGFFVLFVIYRQRLKESKLTEEELFEKEERYRRLVELSPDTIFIQNEGIVTFINLAGVRLLRASSPDQIIGKKVVDFIHPDYRDIVKERIHKLRDDKEIVPVIEEKYLRFDGTYVDVEVTATPFAYKGKTGAQVIVRDITERKKAENLLRESEEKYRSIFEESEDVIYISTPEGKFLDINPAGVRLFGYSSKEEVLNLDIDRDIYFSQSDRLKFKKMVEEKGYAKDFETVVKVKGGDVAIALITAKAHKDEKGKTLFYRGIVRDITDKKRMEAQLFYAQKMEAIGQLAGGVAHDFNNIITAVVGYATLIKMKIKKDDELNTFVDPILSSSERAKKLTQSLLAFGRKQPINLNPVDLNSIIRDIEKLLLKLIREDIIFKFELTEKDTAIFSDHVQIEQILMNLATNASDAMPDGGEIILETDVVWLDKEFISAHACGAPGMYVLMSFTDTGTGMDEATKSKIFEPFFTTKDIGKGTGLGLAMVYGIVKQHNGYINVYSEPGKGTIFRIYIPSLIKHETAEKEQLKQKGSLRQGTETILLAEDDESVRKIIESVLKEFGYKVLTAEDGEEAIKKFSENKDKIKLLLLDLIMPGIDGKEVYERAKKIKPGIKAIFTSGYTMNVIKRKGILDEGFNFISKPILPLELIKLVSKVLEE